MSDGARDSSRLGVLIDDSLRPYREFDVASVSKEKEREILLALSQVFRRVQLWIEEIDSDSDNGLVEFSGGCESHSEEIQCLSKIVTELVCLMTINNQHVQHLVGNVLLVVCEFVAVNRSNWDAFIYFLCVSLELAINTLLPDSSSSSSLNGAYDSDSSSLSFLLGIKDKLKNANLSAVAGIVRVLHHILKDLTQEDDGQLIVIYFDSVNSCLLNVRWDSFSEIFAAPDVEVPKSSIAVADHLVQRFLFLGSFIQFLCSLVEQISVLEASGDSKNKHPVISLAIILVPKLLSWSSGKQGDSINKCIFQYLRYKILVLMIRLSFQTSLDYLVLVSWLQLIHTYFGELLQQPITSLELVQNDSLEGSPFLSSISDEEVHSLSSLHVKRRAIFLFLRCSFSLINMRGSMEEKCTCRTKNLCLPYDTNVELECCGRKKGLIELSNWLQWHIPTEKLPNSKIWLQKRVDFTLSFLQLYMHEDDLLFRVLLQLLCVPFPAEEEFQKEVAAFQDAKYDMTFPVSNIFNPVHLFHLFLAELHYDHQVLLDYLISKDTGISCAEYLLRCLRVVCDSWCSFVEFSLGEQWVNRSSNKKRKKLRDDSTSHAEEYSMPVKNDKVHTAIEKECKEGYKHDGRQYLHMGKPYNEAKECLLALKVSVETLHQKNLFPYNPNVLLKRYHLYVQLLDATQFSCELRSHLRRQTPDLDNTREEMENGGNHFVLIHGACHGAWCWYKVTARLKSMGHKVTTLDLAASGIHLKQVHEVRSLSDYTEPLLDFMACLQPEERVILVGHSMGGVCISLAMERFPQKISVAVFATAFMPGPDLSFSTINGEHNSSIDSFTDTQFTSDLGPGHPPTAVVFGPKFLESNLYQLSPPEDLVLALSLVRPISLSTAELSSEEELTKDKYGSVRRVYIVCKEDNVVKPKLQEWMIENNPVDEVKVIDGSDHMVMFSKPLEFCSCLQEIAEKYSQKKQSA